MTPNDLISNLIQCGKSERDFAEACIGKNIFPNEHPLGCGCNSCTQDAIERFKAAQALQELERRFDPDSRLGAEGME